MCVLFEFHYVQSSKQSLCYICQKKCRFLSKIDSSFYFYLPECCAHFSTPNVFTNFFYQTHHENCLKSTEDRSLELKCRKSENFNENSSRQQQQHLKKKNRWFTYETWKFHGIRAERNLGMIKMNICCATHKHTHTHTNNWKQNAIKIEDERCSILKWTLNSALSVLLL